MFHMGRREKTLTSHKEAIRAAASRHNARSIALVGSVARGDDTGNSDCDFIAEFLPGASLFDHAALEIALEEILGDPVDVLSSAAVRERFPGMIQGAIRI